MRKPRYTDLLKYPHGYRRAVETDITLAWERARKQLERDRKEREEKLRELPNKFTALRRI